MTDVDIDKDKLLESVDCIKSLIGPYKTLASLYDISSTTSFKDSNELIELQKLSQIVKAHSTKIGIVCQPDKFYQNFNAVFKELKEFNDKVFLLLSLLPLFHNNAKDQWAQYFIKKLDSLILNLLHGIGSLCQELERLLRNDDEGKDERLYAIGVIWAACDSLTDLASKGNFQVLADDIRNNCGLVDDVLQDIESWLEDPHFGNDLLIDDDDFESETDEDGQRDDLIESKLPEDEERALQQMKEFLKSWELNIKMIKLLLSSFAKSLSSKVYNSKDSRGSTLDKLNSLQYNVTEQVDDLISDFFVSDSSFCTDDFKESAEKLNKSLKNMVDIIKKLNKSDSKKSRWIQVWETKYFRDDS